MDKVVCVSKKGSIVYCKSISCGKYYIGIHNTWDIGSKLDKALEEKYNCKTCKYKFRCVTHIQIIMNLTIPRILIDETSINPLLCEGE